MEKVVYFKLTHILLLKKYAQLIKKNKQRTNKKISIMPSYNK